MKTAILVAVTEDGKSGVPLTPLLPHDAAMKQFKATDSLPEGFAAIEVFVRSGKRRKLKYLQPAPDSPEAATSLASSDFQSVAVPGLSTSEPGVETPPASEDDSGNNESSEVPSASPKGGRRRGA